MIIAIANQKGGCGKTTITMNIAAALAEQGARVLVADADYQGTAQAWAAAAPDDAPFPATVISVAALGAKLHREVAALADSYDVVLIDCPPSTDSPTTQSALLVADLCLIPTIPSPSDFWAVSGVLKLIESARIINETLETRLIINAHQANHTITGEVVAAIEELGVPVLAQIGQRTAYRQAPALGSSVLQIGSQHPVAAAEIRDLAQRVLAAWNGSVDTESATND